jgi:AcrR family transcriptional regulator
MNAAKTTRKTAKAVKPEKLASASVVEYGRHKGVMRTRVDATAWVDAGIQVLTSQSIDQVGIDKLARLLGVTKGSFYWHFKNRAELQSAILSRWIQNATLRVAERVDREASTPEDRLLRLLELPLWSPRAAPAADLELAIRAWSRRSPLARKAVEEVDAIRFDYLTKLFKSMQFPLAAAVARAHLTYAFMRYLVYLRDIDEAEERALIRDGHKCLLNSRF